ncbi:hypothetical protein like AT1G24580 [Hibiscus trionum]|uniref:RING-type domain-containing protein n=1 Tax=Hibiscus trionum TaxID=183268 RepID=A0A9W7I1S8_HIBTR|nr:hypothetical protein like AT1G24580 [Hibiscus trionum]
MGLSSFPSSPEGVLPVLVMNTVLSVVVLKNMARSFLQVVGASATPSSNSDTEDSEEETMNNAKERRISITQFRSLCSSSVAETDACCVCLNGFEADEEVSELSCTHFFHKGCLQKWFGNKHTTCPVCRSVH